MFVQPPPLTHFNAAPATEYNCAPFDYTMSHGAAMMDMSPVVPPSSTPQSSHTRIQSHASAADSNEALAAVILASADDNTNRCLPALPPSELGGNSRAIATATTGTGAAQPCVHLTAEQLEKIGDRLAEWAERNDAAHAELDHRLDKFRSVTKPPVTVRAYLTRLHKFSGCSDESVILASIYLDHILATAQLITDSFTVHRLLLTCVRLASKYLDDHSLRNSYYARIGGVSCAEMNLLELDLLHLMGFSLFVTPYQFQQYVEALSMAITNDHVQFAAPSEPLSPFIRSPTSTASSPSFSTSSAASASSPIAGDSSPVPSAFASPNWYNSNSHVINSPLSPLQDTRPNPFGSFLSYLHIFNSRHRPINSSFMSGVSSPMMPPLGTSEPIKWMTPQYGNLAASGGTFKTTSSSQRLAHRLPPLTDSVPSTAVMHHHITDCKPSFVRPLSTSDHTLSSTSFDLPTKPIAPFAAGIHPTAHATATPPTSGTNHVRYFTPPSRSQSLKNSSRMQHASNRRNARSRSNSFGDSHSWKSNPRSSSACSSLSSSSSSGFYALPADAPAVSLQPDSTDLDTQLSYLNTY